MIGIWPSGRRVSLSFAAGVLVVIACRDSSAQQAVELFERWAATHVLPIRTVEADGDVADLQQLAPVIGTARVVALGEPAHGAHEPLAFRNRLFQYLVEEYGFTAIAIESGLPESHRIQDFVAGGSGDAAEIVGDSLSYGFGTFRENADLVQWMRAYNTNPSHNRHVRFYGVDLSIAGPRGYTPTPAALDAVLAYLARVDRTSAQRAQTTLQPFLAQLPGAASFSPAEHDRIGAAIDDLISLLQRKRSTFIAATSDAEYQWAQRNAVVARQAERQFRVAPSAARVGAILPGDWAAAEERNRAMADNVRWALAQEGPAGRMLVFAHNAHIMNARMEGGIWSAFARAPKAMGVYLRSGMGRDIVIIGTSSTANLPGLPPWAPDAGNVDAALTRVGLPQFLLDLRTSRTDNAAIAWLTERRTLRANFRTALTLVPLKAFDALVFIETLTRARTAPPSRREWPTAETLGIVSK